VSENMVYLARRQHQLGPKQKSRCKPTSNLDLATKYAYLPQLTEVAYESVHKYVAPCTTQEGIYCFALAYKVIEGPLGTEAAEHKKRKGGDIVEY
jgi:hypothetical protein